MLFKPNTKIRRWLILLFAVSFLLNVQASVACAMMPDMSEQQTECCCGLSHRSTLSSETEDTHSSVMPTADQSQQGPNCDNPRVGCCMLEVSVGLHDPPASDQGLSVPSKNIHQHKTLKQLDDYPVLIAVHAFETATQNTDTKLISALPDPFLQAQPPPLYKITERYRI